MGLAPGELGAVEGDRALGRDVQAGDHVEERGLAGAVGPDERDDAAARDGEVDVVDGQQAAEALRAALGDEQVAALLAGSRRRGDGRGGHRVSSGRSWSRTVSGGVSAWRAASAADAGSSSASRATGSATASLLERCQLVGRARGDLGGHADAVQLGLVGLDREQALGPLDHHHREDDAEDQEVVVDQAEVGQQVQVDGIADGVDRRVDDLAAPGEQGVVDVLDGERADDHAAQRADAAQDDHHDDEDRGRELEGVGEDGRLVGAREGAGEAREAGAQRERQELGRDRVDAHRGCRRLVLADGHPGSTELRVTQAPADEEGEREEHQDQVEGRRRVLIGEHDLVAPRSRYRDRGRVDGVDAHVAAGQVGVGPDQDGATQEGRQGQGEVTQVAEDDGHDLAEAEGHDGQVVAPSFRVGAPSRMPNTAATPTAIQTTIHQLMWMPKWSDARKAVVYAPMA